MTLKNDQGIDIYDCDGTVTRYPTRTRTYAVYPLPLAIRRRQEERLRRRTSRPWIALAGVLAALALAALEWWAL